MLLENRTQAGRSLALKLTQYANHPQGLVLGLPRGGVPVAYEIANSLDLPLDICLVRKLGIPERKELAMGAIASGGVRVLNQDIIDWLKIAEPAIEQVVREELAELSRRDRTYRGHRPRPDLANRTIILVDDGIATGATLRAAIAVLKPQQPSRIIVAIPVAPLDLCQQLETEVDELVCLMKPEQLNSISLWYKDFGQITDEQVRYLLEN
jgi:putative phosphoribosyl transferase